MQAKFPLSFPFLAGQGCPGYPDQTSVWGLWMDPSLSHRGREELRGPAGIAVLQEGQGQCPLLSPPATLQGQEGSWHRNIWDPPWPWGLNKMSKTAMEGREEESQSQKSNPRQTPAPPSPLSPQMDSGSAGKWVSHSRGQNHCKVQLPEILNINKHFICGNTSAKGCSEEIPAGDWCNTPETQQHFLA